MSRAGEFKHLVALQENNQTKNSVGDKIDNWNTYATVWAGLNQFDGTRSDEKYKDDKRHNTTYITIKIYYRDDVKPSHRVVDTGKSRTYEVIHIENPRGEDKELHLTCREII